jgi:hypothetical protein
LCMISVLSHCIVWSSSHECFAILNRHISSTVFNSCSAILALRWYFGLSYIIYLHAKPAWQPDRMHASQPARIHASQLASQTACQPAIMHARQPPSMDEWTYYT